jgi:hypothetical protein
VSVGEMGEESPLGPVTPDLPAASGEFDLHPFWAVLALEAWIDGLLCLSDPLATARHPRPQAHSRTSAHGSPGAPRAPVALSCARGVFRPMRVPLCGVRDRPAWVMPRGSPAFGSDSSLSVAPTAAELHYAPGCTLPCPALAVEASTTLVATR